MKNIVLARVDDRLIHGEVVSVWTPSLNVNRIIVVDDEVAADKFNKRLMYTEQKKGQTSYREILKIQMKEL